MNKKNVKDYHDKMRSEYENKDYRSAQRTYNSFLGELIGDAVNGIGNIFTSRKRAREAREREERERQERLRREAERRRKIKIFIIVIIIAGIGISAFFILKNVFEKSSDAMEKSTDITDVIEGESLTGEVIENTADEVITNAADEVITVDSADTEPAIKKNKFSVKDFANKLFTGIADKLQSTELLAKITDIPQSRNLLYIIGYSLLTLWLGVGSLFFLLFLLKAIIAIFKRRYWRKAGSSLLSSFLVFISITVQYYAFRNIFERSMTGVDFSNVLTIIAFAIFIFSNKIIIDLLRAKNGNAYWGTAFKMIITAVVIYTPVIILIGRY